VQPGYQLTGLREFFKRLRATIAEEGRRPCIVIHATDTFLISAYAFADYMMDGEHGPYITPENPWFSDKATNAASHMQAMNPPAKWGLATLHLEMMAGEWKPMHLSPETRISFRNMLGWMLLHDTEGFAYHYCNFAGIDINKPAEFLPYWDAKTAARINTNNPNVLASALLQGKTLRVLLFNRGKEDANDVSLRIDLQALGLAGKAAVSDPEAGVKEGELNWPGKTKLAAETKDGIVTATMDVVGHNYRLVLVQSELE